MPPSILIEIFHRPHAIVIARWCQPFFYDILFLMKKSTHDVLDIITQNIHTTEEFNDFFTDFLTPKEYKDLLDRIRICQELSGGSTVLQVCKKVNVASATVVRGNRVLKYGSKFIQNLFKKK